MEETLTFTELDTILEAAEEYFKMLIETKNDSRYNRDYKRAIVDLRQTLYQTKGDFFIIKEDNPF